MTSARRAWRHVLAAVGLSAAVVLGGTTLASAETEEPNPSYEPSQEPLLRLEVLTPFCDGDVPYLRYNVDVEGVEPPPTSVKITFVNPGGADYVLEDQPLSGSVLWPGAEVDADGNPLDWPGWSLVDGAWVVGDEWDWVRPSVTVLFEVNPEATATVAYPPSSPDCATDPPGETPPPTDPAAPPTDPAAPPTDPVAAPPGGSSTLPMTGVQVGGVAALAAALFGAGLLTILLVRRRRTSE